MSTTSTALQLGRQLAAIVGPEHVCDESTLLTPFAIDGVRPGATVAPGSPDEVAAVLRYANEHSLSVVPCGGFTKQSLGAAPTSVDILLRTTRLNQVMHYDPGDLTIGVAAGANVGAIQETVAESGLMLPLDVALPNRATVGGVLATSSFGSLKHGYGGVREFCIGITFVTGDSRIAKAGGRVVKNVAGYDLMKLLIGSQGTLGIILAANFKLFTAPRQTRTFLTEFLTLQQADAYRRNIQRSPLSPMCLELLSPLAHRYVGLSTTERWTIAVRAGGSDAVLARYRQELGDAVSNELAGTDEARLWAAIQGFSTEAASQHPNALFQWLHVAPSEILKAFASFEKIATDHNFLFACIGPAALASMEIALIPITVDPPSVTQFSNAVSAMRGVLPRDSALIVRRCPPEVKAHINVWGASSNDVEAMRAVKRVLDPKDILNRGRLPL